MSNKLYSEGKWQAAIYKYQKFLEIHPGDAEIYWRLGQCYRNLNLLDEYFSTLRQGIKLYPTDGNLHFTLIINLRRNGRIQEAIAGAENASLCLPDDYTFQILKYLTVPAIYDNQDEIDFYRQRYIQGLQDLIKQTSLKTPQERNSALAGIGRLTNFHLSYQAQNDIDLQRQYGKLVYEIMAANFPQWVTPVSIPPLQPNQKIRIGYASHYLHSSSGTLWLTGWLRYCDRQNFEIYCYYTGNEPDPVTQQFQDYRLSRGYPPHSPPHPVRDKQFYLLTAACYKHQYHMHSESRRQRLLEMMFDRFSNNGSEEISTEVLTTNLRICAWFVLPNHYHLLVHIDNFEVLGELFRRIHGVTSRQWNVEDNVTKRKIWYSWSDRAIRSERHYYTTLNYLHYNPVKHGLVKSPYDGVESSVHWYLQAYGRQWLRDSWMQFPVRDYGKDWDDFQCS